MQVSVFFATDVMPLMKSVCDCTKMLLFACERKHIGLLVFASFGSGEALSTPRHDSFKFSVELWRRVDGFNTMSHNHSRVLGLCNFTPRTRCCYAVNILSVGIQL